jgi:hypothetical protein
MRGYAEPVNIISGKALVVGGKTTISDELPVGEGWYRAYLRLKLVVVIGTGTGAISEGELKFIKNILFKTDRGEILYNLPGRAIYKMGVVKAGTTPVKDAIAAASATYQVTLPLYFAEAFHLANRPEDTILDTSRYSSLQLEITLGTVADLFTSVGTSSITVTADLEVVRTKGLLPAGGKPIAHVYNDQRPPVDANSTTFILLERANDLAIKRLLIHSCTSGSAGVAWGGTTADTIQDVVNLKDQSGFIVKDRIHTMIQNENKEYYGLEAALNGVEVLDFVQDLSIQSALVTGGKSLLQYQWTNQAGVGASSFVSVAVEGVRGLK